MTTIRRYLYISGGAVVAFVAGGAPAFGSLNLSGSLGYVYQTTTVDGKTSSSGDRISASMQGNSYIWQPWFVLWSARLSGTIGTGKSGSSSSESVTKAGGVSFNVFSRSRFPFTISYDVSDGSVETTSVTNLSSPYGVETNSRSESISANQSYSGLGSMYASGWYNQAKWSATGQTAVTTSALGLILVERGAEQTVQFNANHQEGGQEGAAKRTSENYSLTHSYTPAQEFGIDSAINRSESYDPGAGATERMSASSAFYWRPSYSDYSVNGSIRANESGTTSKARSLNGSLSGSYRYSRSVSFSGNISASADESAAGGRSGSTTQGLSGSFSSDTVRISSVNWRWNTSLSMSNSYSKGGGGEARNTQSMSWGLGHNISHQMRFGAAYSVGSGASQSLSLSKSSMGGVQKTLGHGFNVSLSHRSRGADTSTWFSVSDNRNLSENTSQQTMSLRFNRSQKVSRISSLNGNIGVNWSRSEDASGEASTSSSANGSANYSNSRFFGVYRLGFDSRLTLQKPSLFESGGRVSSSWENSLKYNVGMLSMALNANFSKQHGGDAGYLASYIFMVTRTF